MTSKPLLIGLGVIGALLLGLRAALPTLVTDAVNTKLAENPEYDGHIDGVDIALYRGAYVIRGMVLTKRDADIPVPFIEVDRIDLSVQWKALLRGQVVAEIEYYRPRVNFVNGPTPAQQQAGAGVDWREQVERLVPFEINRLAVYDGEVHYADFSTRPAVDIFVDQLQVEVLNLTNTDGLPGGRVASIEATARPMQLGSLTVRGTVDPYADEPSFDVDMELVGLELTRVNSFIAGYGKADVESGTMEVFAELAGEEGRLVGYVKPMLTGVRVFDLSSEVRRDKDGPLRIVWEALVGAANGLLTNDETGRFAVKVEFSGAVGAPRVATWPAVLSVLRNAFVVAMFHGLDNEIIPKDTAAGGERDR